MHEAEDHGGYDKRDRGSPTTPDEPEDDTAEKYFLRDRDGAHGAGHRKGTGDRPPPADAIHAGEGKETDRYRRKAHSRHCADHELDPGAATGEIDNPPALDTATGPDVEPGHNARQHGADDEGSHGLMNRRGNGIRDEHHERETDDHDGRPAFTQPIRNIRSNPRPELPPGEAHHLLLLITDGFTGGLLRLVDLRRVFPAGLLVHRVADLLDQRVDLTGVLARQTQRFVGQPFEIHNVLLVPTRYGGNDTQRIRSERGNDDSDGCHTSPSQAGCQNRPPSVQSI